MLEEFMNSKVKGKILKFLVFNIGKSYTTTDISRLCKVSKSRSSEVLREFEQAGILNSVAVGKSILYSLNLYSPDAKLFIRFFRIDQKQVTRNGVKDAVLINTKDRNDIIPEDKIIS